MSTLLLLLHLFFLEQRDFLQNSGSFWQKVALLKNKASWHPFPRSSSVLFGLYFVLLSLDQLVSSWRCLLAEWNILAEVALVPTVDFIMLDELICPLVSIVCLIIHRVRLKIIFSNRATFCKTTILSGQKLLCSRKGWDRLRSKIMGTSRQGWWENSARGGGKSA